MSITYEDIRKANEQIRTTAIERKDKFGKVTTKDYAEVNQRIKAFRMVYPEGCILTDMLSNENGVCIFQASIYGGKEQLLATGYAYEMEGSTFINKTSYIENCETSAVGRALGMAGFGIDTSVASYEEVRTAMANQERAEPDQISYIVNMCTEDQIQKLEQKYKVGNLEEISKAEATKIILSLNRRKAKEMESE